MPAVRQILFSAPMIRALLDGRKTQTRRLLKRMLIPDQRAVKVLPSGFVMVSCDRLMWREVGRTYAVGELLWVRETWRLIHTAGGRGGGIVPFNSYALEFRATEHDAAQEFTVEGDDDPHLKEASDDWRPSIFMPRWASRITLAVTEVRVQRLRDIGEADVIAEGTPRMAGEAREDYAALWNHLNDKPGSRWADNPWIVAVSFTVHKANVDTVLAGAAAAEGIQAKIDNLRAELSEPGKYDAGTR